FQIPDDNRMAGRASTTVSASSPSSADKIQSLLRWCQAQTDGYPGVKVTNFTSSFRDGLAFCAILHRYRPELIDFHSLKADNWLQNNQLAFRIAETIGIPALLDAEEMATPEKLSIITYVAYINMHLRGKERRGGPSVNMHSGGNNTSQQQSNASAESASATASSSTPKKRGSSCAMCQGDVFLLERAMDTDGRLCHRQCLLDSRRVDLRRAANEALEKRRRCDNEDAAAVANNGAPLQEAPPATISAVAPSAPATASAQISGPAPTAAASSPFGSPASVRRSARKPAPAPPPPPPSKRAQSQLARSATTVGAASSAKPKTVDVDLYPEEFNPFKDETPVSSSSKAKPPKPPAPPPQRPPPAPRRPQSVAPATAAAAYPEELNPFGEPDDQPKAAKPPPPRPQPAAASSSSSNINKSANSAKPSVSLPATRSSSMEPLYRAGSPGPSAIAGKSFRKSRHAPPPPPQAQGTPKSTSTSNASATAAYAFMPVSAQASPQTTPASTPTHLSASDLHHRSSALRAKGPAPPRPCQSERRQILTEAADEFEGIDAIEQELAAVGAKQADIESRGRVLYDKLKRAELDNSDSEEPLLLEWIGLVNERNRLCREELYLLRRSEERELELQHSSIEFDLRRVMSKQEALKTESDRELERSLLAQLTNVVDRRARIIDLIDASQREQEEQEQLLAATLASASASVQEQKIDKSKKDKKKHKKEERISKLSSIKLKKKPTSSTEQEAGNNNEEKPDQHPIKCLDNFNDDRDNFYISPILNCAMFPKFNFPQFWPEDDGRGHYCRNYLASDRSKAPAFGQATYADLGHIGGHGESLTQVASFEPLPYRIVGAPVCLSAEPVRFAGSGWPCSRERHRQVRLACVAASTAGRHFGGRPAASSLTGVESARDLLREMAEATSLADFPLARLARLPLHITQFLTATPPSDAQDADAGVDALGIDPLNPESLADRMIGAVSGRHCGSGTVWASATAGSAQSDSFLVANASGANLDTLRVSTLKRDRMSKRRRLSRRRQSSSRNDASWRLVTRWTSASSVTSGNVGDSGEGQIYEIVGDAKGDGAGGLMIAVRRKDRFQVGGWVSE
uniref:Calponin-homology (CH) domain-containing protein n=2 Tax=Macrostomum lignano TaxID=282301 RepID=A0A1I8GYC1_9PLAT